MTKFIHTALVIFLLVGITSNFLKQSGKWPSSIAQIINMVYDVSIRRIIFFSVTMEMLLNSTGVLFFDVSTFAITFSSSKSCCLYGEPMDGCSIFVCDREWICPKRFFSSRTAAIAERYANRSEMLWESLSNWSLCLIWAILTVTWYFLCSSAFMIFEVSFVSYLHFESCWYYIQFPHFLFFVNAF